METSQEHIHLFSKMLEGTCSEEEAAALMHWITNRDADLESLVLTELENSGERYVSPSIRERLLNKVPQIIGQQQIDPLPAPPPATIIKTTWLRYAAILLLLAGSAVYLYTSSISKKPELSQVKQAARQDIAPGGNKAVLTLADGSSIILDSASNGQLASQGNTLILKDENGSISYMHNGQAGQAVMMNTMRTPIGGQYQVTLPDGTRVWLNAASSIRYPAEFVGNERSVTITGEVYFEVAENKYQPFLVDIDGKLSIRVLGTSFNINAYADEGSIKTTLLTGSVKVWTPDNSAILKPGYQAKWNTADQSLETTKSANLEQVMAWKNGFINFEGIGLKEVMRQLERWYDITVVYENDIPDIRFGGEMSRNVNLSGVLKILQDAGVHYTMKEGGKQIIISK